MTAEVRPCPLCGKQETQVLLSSDLRSLGGESYKVVACTGCGMRYTHPLPTVQELATYYGNEYYVKNKPRVLSTDFFRLLFQRSVLWRQRRALLDRCPGRILDVGCGNGDFLAGLKRRGWEVYGTEFSEAACELAREQDVTVYQGGLISADLPAGFFDVVTLWHVFEHVPDPKAELVEIRRLLRQDGLLVIEVPNSNSLTFRICGRHWHHLAVPVHLQHFTPKTLRRMLEKCDMIPIQCQSFHHWDFTHTFYSFMEGLGILRRLRIRTYSTTYKQALSASKLIFLMVGIPVSIFSFLYLIVVVVLSGNSETITVTSRKAER